MKFEEINESIKQVANNFEVQHGIRTIKVECIEKEENWAVFLGYKSDNTQTLFFARKGYRATNDRWKWFCPSQNEVEKGFPSVIETYEILNKSNERRRLK